MAQSLFNFNTIIVSLSSPPPIIDGTFTIETPIQGVTKVYLNYNLLNFAVKPFKVILNWPGRAPVVLNDIYIHDYNIDPLSTYSPANSAFSYSVVAPKQITPETLPATAIIYYENGIKHTFNINLNMSSDNIIDLDLDVLDIQNTNQAFTTVFNLQSNSRNVVFNSTDIVIPEKYANNSPSDGYYE
jgi:hypothetical protein